MRKRTVIVMVGVLCTLVLWAVVAVGVVEGLIWIPLAIAPESELAEIYAAMEAVGEGTTSVPVIVVWTVLGGLAALVPTVVALVGCFPRFARFTSWTLIVQFAGFVGAAIIAVQWWATFSMGMSVADTFLTGGRRSDLWPYYALMGLVFLVVAIALAIERSRSLRGRSVFM